MRRQFKPLIHLLQNGKEIIITNNQRQKDHVMELVKISLRSLVELVKIERFLRLFKPIGLKIENGGLVINKYNDLQLQGSSDSRAAAVGTCGS